MYQTYEFKAKDDIKLFYHKWNIDNEKALICVIHGLGEHGGYYQNMVEYFTANGYSVAALDLRGHGRSEGKRGHAGSFDILMQDIDLFVSEVMKGSGNVSHFIYGHSMGGNLVLNYCLRHKTGFNGVIVSGPWLKLAFEPPKYKVILGRLMNRIFPAHTQKSGLRSDTLYHKENTSYNYFKDPLVHNLISVRLFFSINNAGLWALEHAGEFKLPLLIMHGGEDKVTSGKASMEFANANRISTAKVWEGFYHVLHNEPQRDKVFKYVLDWVEKNM